MDWLRSLFRSPPVIGIAAETIDFALEAASDTHPNEYMGMLRAQPADNFGISRDGVLITDIIVMPGTKSGPVSASVKSWVVPNDTATVGSIHSHPNGVLRPSDEDLGTFGQGDVHIIMGVPYDRHCWQAFGNDGTAMQLPVLDVSLPDPAAFFDFDQADIDAELRREGQ